MIGTASSIINDHMNRTAEMIEENASNSFAEADIKKVLGYIKQTGEKGIKHGDLGKKLWRMSANNRKNAISTLLESEQVSAEQVDTGHGKWQNHLQSHSVKGNVTTGHHILLWFQVFSCFHYIKGRFRGGGTTKPPPPLSQTLKVERGVSVTLPPLY